MSRWCLDVVALAVVRGDDADALQALGEIGQHQRDAVADLVVAALGRPLEPDGHDDQRRHDTAKTVMTARRHVGGEQEDRDHHHGQALDGELGQTRPGAAAAGSRCRWSSGS